MTSVRISTDFLTVATVGYLPQALATLRSAREAGQFMAMHVFALDAAEGSIEKVKLALGSDTEWLNVFGPEDLDDELWSTFHRAFDYYNPVEMSCLAKYVGVSYVLKNSGSAERCVFSDSDILFLSDPKGAIEELGDKAMLLTPHQLGPSTDAAEHDYLLHGWINAGFFIINRDNIAAKGILNWLIDRISRRGFLAPELGLSCDQTWVSLLPGLFTDSVAISRFAGYNVAYWNLVERKLGRLEGRFEANGAPLVFFHFSGFFGAPPGQLTKHGDFCVQRGSTLDDLCQKYRSLLNDCAALNISGIPVMSCSRGSLKKRITISSQRNQTNIEAPTIKRGIFTRIGGKVDALIRQFLH
jgi:hypothetical protein